MYSIYLFLEIRKTLLTNLTSTMSTSLPPNFQKRQGPQLTESHLWDPFKKFVPNHMQEALRCSGKKAKSLFSQSCLTEVVCIQQFGKSILKYYMQLLA